MYIYENLYSMTLEDVRKSIDKIIHERLTSPFWGTLLVSWLFWNWRVPYVSLFVSEKALGTTRIDYIINNCTNIWKLVYNPLISTAIILFLFPFLSELIYRVTLWFAKRKRDMKKKFEKKELLSVEQSLALYDQMDKQEQKYNTRLNQKDNEIELLKTRVEELTSKDLGDNETLKVREQQLLEIQNVLEQRNAEIKTLRNKVNDDSRKDQIISELSEELEQLKGVSYSEQVIKAVTSLQKMLSIESIDNTFGDISSGIELLKDEQGVQAFVKLNIAEIDQTNTTYTNRATYKLEAFGKLCRQYFYNEVL